MKRRSVIVMSLLLVGLAVFWDGFEASGQGSGEWITLFDGKNLDKWNRLGDANWTLADGVVQVDKKSGKSSAFLVSKDAYTDFELRVEFWVDATATAASSSAAPIRKRSLRPMPMRSTFSTRVQTQVTAPGRSLMSPRSIRCPRLVVSGTPTKSLPRVPSSPSFLTELRRSTSRIASLRAGGSRFNMARAS